MFLSLTGCSVFATIVGINFLTKSTMDPLKLGINGFSHADLYDVFREVENCTARELIPHPIKQVHLEDSIFSLKDLEFLGSGKAAISLILRYLTTTKILQNKTDEIIVPEWLGSWVYAQITNHAFPTKILSSKTKALFVYHQYGFPQNMMRLKEYADKNNLTIIEDCAHTLGGISSNGIRLGHFGDYSLYSFSKFFFCHALGAVRSKDQAFLDFVEQEKKSASRWVTTFNNFSKGFSEYSVGHLGAKAQNLARQLTIMSYGLYNEGYKPSSYSVNLAKRKLETEITTRQKYYSCFREQTDCFGICDHLETEYIFPYVIPIKISEKHKKPLIEKLRNNGFSTGLYNFDMNRFYIEPQFEQCAWIFCHSGLTESDFERQLECVKKVLS